MLGVGEVVFRGPQDSVPSNVVVFHDPDFHPAMLKEWTDRDVIERMKGFFEEHSELARTPDIPVLNWYGEEAHGHKVPSKTVRPEDILRNEGFARNYLDSIKDPTAESKRLVEELVVFYVTRAGCKDGAFETAQLLLRISAVTYGPPKYQPDLDYIRKSIDRLLGDKAERPNTRGGVIATR